MATARDHHFVFAQVGFARTTLPLARRDAWPETAGAAAARTSGSI
jgi:hypothetical protein